MDNSCYVSAVSSSAARCLARESQMRGLDGSSDGETRSTTQHREVTAAACSSVRLPECSQSPQECTPPQPTLSNAARVKPPQPKFIVEALAVVTERLSWATEELRRASSVETCCQLCLLIRSCADAMQALKRVDDV